MAYAWEYYEFLGPSEIDVLLNRIKTF